MICEYLWVLLAMHDIHSLLADASMPRLASESEQQSIEYISCKALNHICPLLRTLVDSLVTGGFDVAFEADAVFSPDYTCLVLAVTMPFFGRGAVDRDRSTVP